MKASPRRFWWIATERYSSGADSMTFALHGGTGEARPTRSTGDPFRRLSSRRGASSRRAEMREMSRGHLTTWRPAPKGSSVSGSCWIPIHGAWSCSLTMPGTLRPWPGTWRNPWIWRQTLGVVFMFWTNKRTASYGSTPMGPRWAGSWSGTWRRAQALDIDELGHLYILDRDENEIHVFSQTGQLLEVLGPAVAWRGRAERPSRPGRRRHRPSVHRGSRRGYHRDP